MRFQLTAFLLPLLGTFTLTLAAPTPAPPRTSTGSSSLQPHQNPFQLENKSASLCNKALIKLFCKLIGKGGNVNDKPDWSKIDLTKPGTQNAANDNSYALAA